MDTRKPQNRYDEVFKKSYELCRNGKTQTKRCKEYGVSSSAPHKWVRQYSIVQTENGDVLTDKHFKELQKRNAQLEEALIFKKAIVPFTPRPNNG